MKNRLSIVEYVKVNSELSEVPNIISMADNLPLLEWGMDR